MKKYLKNTISLVLAMVLCASAFAPSVSAKAAKNELKFGDDGKFTILQIADIQDGADLKSITKDFIAATVDKVKPDLVVLTGDNISGYRALTKRLATTAITKFMSVFEERRVPVAMVFGNHDDESTTASKEFQMSVYEQFSCFVGEKGEDMTGYGNYNLPIMSSDGSKIAFNLWMIDSLNYNKKENKENDLGGYGSPHKDQIDWYVKTSNELKAANGGKVVNSMMFQHIIVPEIYDALVEVPKGTQGAVANDGKYYVLPDTAAQGSYLGESPCPPEYTNGQFDAIVNQGDVLALFVGHDHANSFSVPYRGVDIVCTPGVGFRSYGGESRAMRVITLDESDTTKYETSIVDYFDVFGNDDSAAANRYKLNAFFGNFFNDVMSWFKNLGSSIASFFNR